MKTFLLTITILFVNNYLTQTISIGKIQVSTSDLSGYYTKQQITDYLASNNDWRLPTINELQTIYNNRSSLTGIKYGYDSYLASGNQNNFTFPNSQAEYGWAETWSLGFANGRWVQPTTNSQLCIRLVKKENSAAPSVFAIKQTKTKKTKNTKSSSGDCITTYSASYGLTGYDLDQPEAVFNLETTYESNERFTQLYRWRYALGDFRGLIFEYNNRVYFGKNRDYDNSKWFLQGKVGYGLLKGKTYAPNSVGIYDPINLSYGLNTESLTDNTHFILDYGLVLGYKFIMADRFTLDFGVGYSGYTKPKYSQSSPNESFRADEWQNGFGSPVEVLWSIGFFLD